MTTKIESLLADLEFENPAPEEKWFSRYWFDPHHGKTELRGAAMRGLIELDTSHPENWRFRLTPKARDRLNKKDAA